MVEALTSSAKALRNAADRGINPFNRGAFLSFVDVRLIGVGEREKAVEVITVSGGVVGTQMLCSWG